MQFIKKTHRRGTRKDLNGPRTKSEEPNLIGRDAIGLKHPNSTPFPLKSGSEHRPATKPKFFKPTLYKSYCEGPFVCEPKNINGPQRNRVLTIIIKTFKYVCIYIKYKINHNFEIISKYFSDQIQTTFGTSLF